MRYVPLHIRQAVCPATYGCDLVLLAVVQTLPRNCEAQDMNGNERVVATTSGTIAMQARQQPETGQMKDDIEGTGTRRRINNSMEQNDEKGSRKDSVKCLLDSYEPS